MGLLYKSNLSTVGKSDARKANSEKVLSVLNENAEKEIDAYTARHPKLRGFIFDIPEGVTRMEAEILSGLLKGAVSSIGIGIRLRSRRTLVLVPASLDQELVSHRIRANFQTANSYTFSMTGNDDIKAIIKNY
jgi:hypothetical protein